MSSESPGEGENIPLPEYEMHRYFPQRRDLSDEERAQLREEYGWIRAYFKMRPERYRGLQEWLDQARFGTTYDVYLARTVLYAAVAAVVGYVLGIAAAEVLARAGVLSGLRSPVAVRGGVVAFVSQNKVWLASALISVLGGLLIGAAVWAVRYYHPKSVSETRRRNIDFTLPSAIVFMYALSYGGMNLLEVVERLSNAEDAYGEVAAEFDMVMRDVNLFGNDLYTALRNARNLTPSENLEQFLDDLLSVLETGGDSTAFFQEQSKTYLRRASEEQEDFLETLGVLSEIFIVGFVAAPLFLVVILMVISILGGTALPYLYVLIYAGLPLGMAFFLVLLSTLSNPYRNPSVELDDESPDLEIPPELSEDPAFEAYQKGKRWLWLREILEDPLRAVKDRPTLTLAISVPVALFALLTVVGSGQATLSDLGRQPVQASTLLFVVPFLIVTVPLSFFHELKRGRENEIARRFPDTLNILSSANNMGIPLTDALEIVARWSGGRFAEELRSVRNDIDWNNDTEEALLSFANRIQVPQVSRTIKLIAEGGRSTGDLSRVLGIAAEDTRNQYVLVRNRRRAMSSYLAVVIIGYLVYLMVIVLLDMSYLTPLSALATGGDGLGPEIPLGFTSVPVETYRMLFFHSVLIQGVGTGLLAGELADSDALSGLKYSILLVSIALLAFRLL